MAQFPPYSALRVFCVVVCFVSTTDGCHLKLGGWVVPGVHLPQMICDGTAADTGCLQSQGSVGLAISLRGAQHRC